MDLSPFHVWFVFIHVVGVFIFLLGHGISAGVLWRLRTEREPATVRMLLDFSRRSMGFMGVGFLVWFLAGILAGFSGNYWTTGTYWIWASLGIALGVVLAMTPLGRIYFNRIRLVVGIDPKSGNMNPNAVVDPAALDAAIESGRPMLLAVLGVAAVVVLAWLMFFKPF